METQTKVVLLGVSVPALLALGLVLVIVEVVRHVDPEPFTAVLDTVPIPTPEDVERYCVPRSGCPP